MRDRLISLRERLVSWILWSPRRLATVLGIAVAVVAGSVLLGAIAGSRGGPTDPTAATDDSLHAQDIACRAAVTRWGEVFADPTFPDAEWIPLVRAETTDRADTWVPMTARDLIPHGPLRITATRVDRQTCEATVSFSTGATWVVEAVPVEGSRWAVDTWDDGS